MARRRPVTAADPPSGSPDDPDAPTAPLPHLAPDPVEERSTVVRLFGSDDFFRLWMAQVVSAIGDWIGFVAIVAIASRVGGGSGAAAVSLVMMARMVPGFFLAPVAGVLVDRWDRKRVMVSCDLLRAGVLVFLPFVDTVWGLVVASLLLEVGTLLWSPAKEASVPNLVPSGHLTTANSLSLAAAYGTFPIATLLFAFAAKLAEWLSGFSTLEFLRINQESVAIYLDVLTFVLSAFLISALALPSSRRNGGIRTSRLRIDFGATFRELGEGWRFMFSNPVVRAIMIALGTGLFGGGMVVPLGDIFSRQVLGGGSAGFGLLLSAMGFGVAGGVLLLSAVQRRIPKNEVFYVAVLGAGATLGAGAAMSSLTPALGLVAVLGVCAGAVYVLGFTILHETVADEFRGRIFSSLYTLVRFCLLLSFAVGPLLADRLDALSNRLFDGRINVGATSIALPGVRLALWLAATIIIAAGVLAVLSLRFSGRPQEPAPER
jgi:MFS family permease